MSEMINYIWKEFLYSVIISLVLEHSKLLLHVFTLMDTLKLLLYHAVKNLQFFLPRRDKSCKKTVTPGNDDVLSS